MKKSIIKGLKIVVGLVISYMAYSMLNLEIDEFQNVLNDSRRSFGNLLVVLSLIITSFCFRAFKWMYIIGGAERVRVNYLNFFQFLFSVGLNILLPLRLGDIYRISRGKNLLQQTSGFVVEKFTDIMILIQLVLLVSIFQFAWINSLLGLGALFTCIFVAILPHIFVETLLKITHRFTFLSALSLFLEQILIYRGTFYRNILTLTYVAWLVEATAFVVLAAFLSNGTLWLDGFCVFPISTLSTMIPSAPGFIGTFDLATSSFLENMFWERDEALEFTVLIHATLIVSSLIMFLVSFILSIFLRHSHANI